MILKSCDLWFCDRFLKSIWRHFLPEELRYCCCWHCGPILKITTLLFDTKLCALKTKVCICCNYPILSLWWFPLNLAFLGLVAIFFFPLIPCHHYDVLTDANLIKLTIKATETQLIVWNTHLEGLFKKLVRTILKTRCVIKDKVIYALMCFFF